MRVRALNSETPSACPYKPPSLITTQTEADHDSSPLPLSLRRTMSRNFLSMNDELQKGDFLLSNNRKYRAVFQEDGNFVVYGCGPVWASNTCGITDAHRLIMQEDCNLVIYTPCKPVWSTNTNRSGVKRCRLTLRDDGTLVVENDGAVVWKST
ncbi:B-type lectin plumieribetin [Ictalurus punctatus]|uniref:B-type lectin plumieribetin n=1 Tax=Ictalurus punctatus TaxID=7998 RepID=A0A2D0QT60_ICTPU|nr:B-type lectin plumieribetin [Ictalurus punctatus]